MIFGAIVNSGVFEILFSNFLLLAYRNTIEFCVSIMYPVTLLNLLVLLAYFFVCVCRFFEVSYVNNHVICGWRQFYFFPVFMHFIFLFYFMLGWIEMVRANIFALFPVLTGKALNLSLLHMIIVSCRFCILLSWRSFHLFLLCLEVFFFFLS